MFMKAKNQKWWDLPAALFLSAALFVAALRLQATNWTENLANIGLTVLLGAGLGFALGKSLFNGRVTFLLGFLYSLFLIPWQLSLLIPNEQWLYRLSLLYARIWYAIADFLANKPVKDPILFFSAMMLLYWFASLLSAYQLIRRTNPWIPLLTLGVMILVIEYTVETYRLTKIVGANYSLFFLIFCLLLMGRIYYLRSKKDWEGRGGTVEADVGYDLGRGVAIAAVVIALLAWNAPRVINLFDTVDPTRERVTRSWEQFRNRISKAVVALRSSGPVIIEGYANNMFLGTGGSEGENIVFTVKPAGGQPSVRMYWTARSYDRYEMGQWTTSISDLQPVGPGHDSVAYPKWALRRNLQFTINSRIPLLKTLYTPPAPLTVSREAQAVVSVAEDGTMDLDTLIIDPPLRAGEEYSVRSLVPQPTVLAMQEAGIEYPDWVTSRYLQLPENFSPEIVALARQIAGDEETAYDQAIAITRYLRRTITYSVTVPEYPRNREPLEWFLFDQRAGFCNYYASAEVVMLRSLGVPARIAVGYAEGKWVPETGVFEVVGKDSHAWPEVYFPNLGWVAFEPTVSQPASNYPLGEVAQQEEINRGPSGNLEPTPDPLTMLNQNNSPINPQDLENIAQPREPISPWVVAAMTGLILVGLLAFLEWRRRKIEDLPLPSWLEKTLDEQGFRTPELLRAWSRRALRTPMENQFTNVAWMLRVWGQKIEPALTPAEQVALLVNVVPAIRQDALALLEEYHRAMYSQYPANLARAKLAVRGLKATGLRAWVLQLIGFEA